MVINNNIALIPRSWPWWRWIMIVLNVLALILSTYLSWHYLEGSSMAGCGGGSPCDQVLNSPWSMFGGVLPVSGLAVGVYLAMLVGGFYIRPETEAPIRHLAWSVMLILSGIIAGSAVWFTIIQKWIIGAFCPYCMTTHITGLLLVALVIWRAMKEFENPYTEIKPSSQKETKKSSPPNARRVVALAMVGLIIASIMARSQVVLSPEAVCVYGESQNKLPVIDYPSAPMIGSVDAPFIVTLLFEYQCPHCQKIHFMLDEVVRRYAGKLSFVLCPTPLNTQCNPYIPRDVDAFKNSCELARIGLAVWLADRAAFSDFEKWMFTFESGNGWHPRSLETAKAKAIELIGRAKFDTAMSDPWIGKYIQNCVQIYGQTLLGGKGGIPKMVFGSHWVIPEPQKCRRAYSDFAEEPGFAKALTHRNILVNF